MSSRKLTVSDIVGMKGKEKIAALTAYDYTSAKFVDRAGMDLVLVGDSASMVIFGHEGTRYIGMDEMLMLTEVVARTVKRALVVADLPFMSVHLSKEKALENAFKLIRAGADAVKMEWFDGCLEKARAIVNAGIPLVGHIGFTPQLSDMWTWRRRRGVDEEGVEELLREAKGFEEAGAFSVVLEMVSVEGSKRITESLSIPTIGIGSGPYCDGQILVYHDVLGLYEDFKPKFAKRYLELATTITEALKEYVSDVKEGRFPSEEHSFHMKSERKE